MKTFFIGVALGLLAACTPETPPETTALPTEASCAAKGGTWVRGMAGHACAMPAPDAGKSCRANADCSTFCLAQTRQCAPTTPYFGCFVVLTAPGQTAMLCVD